MKVLHIIFTTTGYKVSGAVSAALSIAQELNRLVDTKVLIMSDKNQKKTYKSLEVIELKSSSGLFDFIPIPERIRKLFLKANVEKYILAEKPDIVHFHNPIPTLAVLKAARFCKINGIKYVMTSHGFNEMFNFSKSFKVNFLFSFVVTFLVHYPLKYVLKNAEILFLLSPNELEDVKKYLKVGTINYAITPNGYPVDVKISSLQKETCRFRFLFETEKPTIFYLGNHTQNKGLDVLIKSVELLKYECTVIIGGKTKIKGGKHEFMGKDLSSLSKNIYFTGFLEDHEKFYLLANCNFLVHPTRADTLPLSIIEAMYFEKAVVSTTVGGIPSLVDADTGVLVPAGDAIALANAIDCVLSEPGNAIKMGVNGRKKVLSKFSWEKSALHTFEAYKKAVRI